MTTIGPNGMGDPERAWAPPRDPLTRAADPNIIYRDVPASVVTEWTIADIAAALVQHQSGQFARSAQLVDAVIADPRVRATLGTRTAALLGQPLEHHRPESDAPRADEAHEEWKRTWGLCVTEAVLSDVLRWTTMLGFALMEILWDTTVTPWRPYLKVWNPQYVYYRIDLRRYVAITLDGPVEVTPGDGKWILIAPHGQYRGWSFGCVRSVAMPWLLRQFAFRDWARYSEIHGIPILLAMEPAAGDGEQKKRWRSQLATLGQESIVALPQGVDGFKYDLKLLEATDKSWEAFQGLIDRCDMSIVLPILGQNLTTEVQEGSMAAARVHGDVRQNIVEADNTSIHHDLHQQLARPWAKYNYGDADLATYTCRDVRPPEDHVRNATVLREFATSVEMLARAGVEIDVAKLAAQYGIPIKPQPSPTPIVSAPGAGKIGPEPREP